MWFRYWRTEFCSSLIFLLWFTGLHDYSYDDVDDAVLEEHYNALGLDLSFWGWVWEIKTCCTDFKTFWHFCSFLVLVIRLICIYILLGPEPNRLQNSYFCFALLHLFCNSTVIMNYKWMKQKSLFKVLLCVRDF